MRRKKIIALVSNNIATDQRLIKVGTTLSNRGYEFLLVGTTHRGKPELNLPFFTHRISLFFDKGALFYAELNLRLLLYLLTHLRSDHILLANDLDTLLPAYIVAKLKKTPLAFDSHEIFSELPALNQNPKAKKVWKTLEKFLMPRLKTVYTVSNSYAQWFEKEYHISCQLIQNLPFLAKTNRGISHSDSPYTLIYQGAMNPSRGIEKMILTMHHLPDCQLWLVGDGPELETYKELAQQQKLENQIKFWGRIAPEKLKEITSQAHLGLSLEEASALSYRYALPNKLFDYIHAGIPVLGTWELPEVEAIVTKYGIGAVIQNNQAQHIAERVKFIRKYPFSHWTEKLETAALQLNWQNQEQDLVAIFDGIASCATVE